MSVLAHIHTFNDADVIDRSLAAIRNQTYPVDRILLVDNGSSDGTLDRGFPEDVEIIRHGENLGTSGAVVSGMQYAIDHGFDWIWIFDADSAPRRDALEELMAFYARLSQDEKTVVQRLCSWPVEASGESSYPGIVFTDSGFRHVSPPPDATAYPCHAQIWTGSLFRVCAIRAIGLPPPDYVLDLGECEYGYQAMRRGYQSWVIRSSVLEHNIGGNPTTGPYALANFGPLSFKVMKLPAIRLYYIVRNNLYFWAYEFEVGRAPRCRILLGWWLWIAKHLFKLLLTRRWTELGAGLRGIRDGLLKRLDRRY